MIRKTTRSILSVLLAVLLLVTSIPLTPAFAGGGGTVSPQSESAEGRALEPAADGKYYISTAEQLEEFAKLVNNKGETTANAVLTDDINLNPDMKIDEDGKVTNGSELDQWTPIGNEEHLYTGTFDGNGHTISGLTITGTSDNVGLFGYVGTGGKIEKLTVSGSVNGNNFVGGVVGYNNGGTVTGCTFSVSGSVSGGEDVGGVVGYNNGGTVTGCTFSGSGSVSGDLYVGGVVGVNSSNVENCYNIGKVTGSADSSNVGGVVGYNYIGGSVKNSYNTGAVSGGEEVGGVVGYNIDSVTNCYNTGTVTGSSDNNVGGVVGYNYIGSVTNCYNTGEVSGNSKVGGVVGNNEDGPVTNCYNTGSVSGGSSKGGVVGANSGSNTTVTGCYFLKTGELNSELSGIGNDSSEPDETAVDDLNALCGKFVNDTDWSISGILGRPVLKSNPQGGLGNEDSPYEIRTAAELENFATAVNNGIEKSAHAKLMNNIDLSSVCGAELDSGRPVSWTPIGNFNNKYTGTFDGNNYTISGLYIASNTSSQGLFGYVYGGTVQNLTVTGSVNGGWYVGGVVGCNNGGTVTGCTFSGSGSVSGFSSVGGVVGLNSGSVTSCTNTGTGTVSGPDSGTSNYVGGVVGYNISSGNVKNCYNTGNISGETSGGVVGLNDGNVTSCYNTGSGSGNSVGGVVGYNDSSASVTNCYFLKTADVNENLSGIGSGGKDTDSAIEKEKAAFQSGEVAWLLEDGQPATQTEQIWGQTLSGEEKSLPTLVALDKANAQKVYQVTFDYGDSFAEADDRYDYHYGNANDTVTLPTSTDQIPEYEGHTLTGWQDADKNPVSGESVTVTADTTYTAEWTVNTYTITVTAGSGGTVSGGGSVTHGDSVEVTATANPGYHFVNWTENGTQVSTSDTYSFTATANRTLTANFAADAVAPDPTPTPTPDPEPTGPSTGDSTGWADILDELENAENGDQITIDMGDETTVPAEIFAGLAGKDVDVIFDLGDVQWSASGETIPTDTDFTDLDLGASLGTSGIPVNVINAITGEVGTVQITLAHDGAFGFTMTLTAPLGKENAGYWANLYHYDEEAEALNFEAAAKIDEDGSVTIPFSHASQYAIVIDTHSHATVDVSDLFIDIAPDAWYKDAVQYAYDNGLMTGVSATEFAPEQTTTRAMIVSILARLEGVTTAQAAGFADVTDEWYATAVNWAANVGVVNGYEDGTFKPNTAITREQLAAILMNYAAYKGYDVSARADLSHYSDADSISSWANDVLLWAVAEGLLTGVTDDTIAPQAHATRAQVAAILQRFLSE